MKKFFFFYRPISALGLILFLFVVQSFSLYNSKQSNDSVKVNCEVTYEQLLDGMKKYESRYDTLEIGKLYIYLMAYLDEGLKYRRIVKNELDKFTYLLEFHVSEDGNIQNVIIRNSEFEGSNDKYFIEFLMKMPQCEFWKSYSGTDKDSITTILIPLVF